MTAAVVALVLIAAVVGGGVAYGRWAGWGFGLGWWGRPTPAQVRKVEPLKGALMKGGAPWAVREARHRVRAHLDIHPPTRASYVTSTITWVDAGGSPVGRDVTVRASRTRNGRVHLSPAAAATPSPEDPTAGRY